MKRLVLVGGGHAHLSVLARLAQEKSAKLEVLLVTPGRNQYYSGMLPGWMAGHYTMSQCRIDLLPLAKAAGVQLIDGRLVGMNAERRSVDLSDGRQLEYDFLSLDSGSETNTSWLHLAGDKLLPAKPLDGFFANWPKVLAAAQLKPDYRLIVVGGGAAGIELALAARQAFRNAKVEGRVELVASESSLLTGHANSVRQRVLRYLSHSGIVLHRLKATGFENGLLLADGTLLAADCVIAATGAQAPLWLRMSGLQLDTSGYVAVNASHRSLSYQNVFAAGDVCSRQDVLVPRSGVHAVYAGPVLAENLLAALNESAMTTYQPRRHSLYLLACGPRYAIASWGRFSLEGAWVWYWKRWIDRGFIKRFSV